MRYLLKRESPPNKNLVPIFKYKKIWYFYNGLLYIIGRWIAVERKLNINELDRANSYYQTSTMEESMNKFKNILKFYKNKSK